jgi:hypothetical protein
MQCDLWHTPNPVMLRYALERQALNPPPAAGAKFMMTKKRERAHRRKDWEYSPFRVEALRSFFLDVDGGKGWLGLATVR